MPVRNENGIDFGWALIKLVNARDLWENSEFLETFFALGRKKRRRIKQLLLAKRYAKIKEYSRVAVLEENFVSAYFVDAAVER